jgi:hypothetical protein
MYAGCDWKPYCCIQGCAFLRHSCRVRLPAQPCLHKEQSTPRKLYRYPSLGHPIFAQHRRHIPAPYADAIPIFIMEPVSLRVSAMAPATIFDSALNCFKHVKVAKPFGLGYQTYEKRLL